MTLTTSQLREAIEDLDFLVVERDGALRRGDLNSAEGHQRDWEDEARHLCFQAGVKGRAAWYTGATLGTVLYHLGRVPTRYKVAFVGGAVGASLVRRARR